MILAIETATDVCSVALRNNEGERFEKRTESRGSHSEKLFLFIRDLMDEHQFAIDDLSSMLVSEGPGSYTGLRIAASGIKGLLFGTDVPLYAVSTMASFACSVKETEKKMTIHAIIDARRVHVYHRKFTVSGGILIAEKEVEVIPIEVFEKLVLPGDIIVGTGLKRLDQSVVRKAHAVGKESITARSLIDLYEREERDQFVRQVSPEAFDPRYHTSNQVES